MSSAGPHARRARTGARPPPAPLREQRLREHRGGGRDPAVIVGPVQLAQAGDERLLRQVRAIGEQAHERLVVGDRVTHAREARAGSGWPAGGCARRDRRRPASRTARPAGWPSAPPRPGLRRRARGSSRTAGSRPRPASGRAPRRSRASRGSGPARARPRPPPRSARPPPRRRRRARRCRRTSPPARAATRRGTARRRRRGRRAWSSPRRPRAARGRCPRSCRSPGAPARARRPRALPAHVGGARDRGVEGLDRLAHAARLEQRGAERGQQRASSGTSASARCSSATAAAASSRWAARRAAAARLAAARRAVAASCWPSSRRSSTARSRW